MKVNHPFGTDEKVSTAYKLLVNRFESATELYNAVEKEVGGGRHLDPKLYRKKSITYETVRACYNDPAKITWQTLPLLNLAFPDSALLSIAGDIPVEEFSVWDDKFWVSTMLQHLVLAFLKLQPCDQENILAVTQTMSRAPKVTADTFMVHAEACRRIEDEFIEWQCMSADDVIKAEQLNLYNETSVPSYGQFRHIDGRPADDGEREAVLDKLKRTRLTQPQGHQQES